MRGRLNIDGREYDVFLTEEQLEELELKPFYFGCEHTITPDTTSFLFIGRALAPEGLEGRCLIVNRSWRAEVFEHNGRQLIKFVRA